MEVERLEAELFEVRNSQTAAEDKLAQATTRNVALTSDLGSAHDVTELEHAKATIEKLSGQLAAANGALNDVFRR
ncbi:hypothetical protein A0H81_12522 [Grifola frondosa]|uniref:Uncharacterized protein n=1 Tax=Grifola frondosa TaxID=5627 RepID=A0A1C7LRK8_GRIFR|nr:hypothetical protein A0H81_12522 [Grifola frondosa]